MAGISHRSVRGFLANISVRPILLLTFQWNPESYKDSKSVKYEDKELGGYAAPMPIFVSGGSNTIEFELDFDATENSRDLSLLRVDIPLLGIEPAIQTLKSFMYPTPEKALEFKDEMFGEPPDVYFGFGPRVVRGRVRKVDTEYQLFNALLVPLRARASINFVIDEMGIWNKVNEVYRRIATISRPATGGLI